MPESVNSSMPIQHVGVHWAQVARLAMVSQAAVFRDIAPGYRVRLPTDKELAMPVSKDVRRLRDHEAALLRAYQARPPRSARHRAGMVWCGLRVWVRV